MTIFTVHEAKTNLSKLIAEAIAGGEVVIARGAVPAVRLVPVNAPGKRRFGALRDRIAIDARFEDPLPDDELSAWGGE
ncbi:type II toxin-antitoxin system Phd/YefM family antitoxin [Sphingomonas nostoxanthinifaciens]|uniref:type II toxin-antitoxin system Phd/YefM family antitoxin n=1 Tax=Sphingomonas nostoxanthinifaciens TaxID=2872652 RepID=UPI001CC1CCD9|nr:type II toxin-antitoxin system prevent-host-death family antitoxin [Sphingomonas nostoxanthinifaciens]UAK25083.1 type II toxin-antitoxin system prevent-host-death family antitoxin [Sphingomonas nostoxanthinifaciens]